MALALILERWFPGAAARYWQRRRAAVESQRLYQAATSNQFHPYKGDSRSGSSVMEHARHRVAYWARQLEENHDLVVGIFHDLTDRVVGTGIKVEPQPKLPDGSVDVALADTMRRAYEDWRRRPEVSQVLDAGEVERLLFRSLIRDGEVLYKHLRAVNGYKYPTATPYAIDPLECDWLPFDLVDRGRANDESIVHGIERDRFGTITGYYLLKQHPGDYLVPLQAQGLLAETVRVPRDQIEHLRISRRIGQLRGISILHSSTHRMQDQADFEESYRIKAKIDASFTAAITKSPDAPGIVDRELGASGDRDFEMAPAMIFDRLRPGESIETIETKTPGGELEPYRAAMLKATSAGTDARYSTVARTWDSSYTAMRQESTVMKGSKDRLQAYFIDRVSRVIYEQWVRMSLVAGVFPAGGVDMRTVLDADYLGPTEPWLDPLDEAKSDILLKAHGIKSREQIIKERGGDRRKVDAARETDPFTPETTGAGLETEQTTPA